MTVLANAAYLSTISGGGCFRSSGEPFWFDRMMSTASTTSPSPGTFWHIVFPKLKRKNWALSALHSSGILFTGSAEISPPCTVATGVPGAWCSLGCMIGWNPYVSRCHQSTCIVLKRVVLSTALSLSGDRFMNESRGVSPPRRSFLGFRTPSSSA